MLNYTRWCSHTILMHAVAHFIYTESFSDKFLACACGTIQGWPRDMESGCCTTHLSKKLNKKKKVNVCSIQCNMLCIMDRIDRINNKCNVCNVCTYRYVNGIRKIYTIFNLSNCQSDYWLRSAYTYDYCWKLFMVKLEKFIL